MNEETLRAERDEARRIAEQYMIEVYAEGHAVTSPPWDPTLIEREAAGDRGLAPVHPRDWEFGTATLKEGS